MPNTDSDSDSDSDAEAEIGPVTALGEAYSSAVALRL